MMPNRNEDSEVKGLVITFPSFCLLDPKTSLHDKYCLYLRFTSPLRYYSTVPFIKSTCCNKIYNILLEVYVTNTKENINGEVPVDG